MILERPPNTQATPHEVLEADMIDLEKLNFGLESRTACCQRLVPTDCMNAVCGHGEHQDREGRFIEDTSCIHYLTGDILYHEKCPGFRTSAQAEQEANELWEAEEDQNTEDRE